MCPPHNFPIVSCTPFLYSFQFPYFRSIFLMFPLHHSPIVYILFTLSSLPIVLSSLFSYSLLFTPPSLFSLLTILLCIVFNFTLSCAVLTGKRRIRHECGSTHRAAPVQRRPCLANIRRHGWAPWESSQCSPNQIWQENIQTHGSVSKTTCLQMWDLSACLLRTCSPSSV